VAKLPGLPTTVELGSVDRYPQDVETTVYFCCVEAMQNALKHAGDGATVHVRVWEDGARLRFSVTDDGVGFDPVEVTLSGHGFGNMADRLRALGGSIDITSSPGGGACVSGWVPLIASATP
jgi:signal transduction histidine kinase